jgi:hypothetical protein
MPPRIRLTDDEARHLPGLLQFQPLNPESFQDCRTTDQRLLWILAAYQPVIKQPLTAALITLLIFKHGPNIALRTVIAALSDALASGFIHETDGGYALSPAD